MWRTSLATITLFMLLLTAALTTLWIRSYHIQDRLIFNRVVNPSTSAVVELASSRGRLQLVWDRLNLSGPERAVARHMADPFPLGAGVQWVIARPAVSFEAFAAESFWTRCGFGFDADQIADPAPSPMSGIVAHYDRATLQIPYWAAQGVAIVPLAWLVLLLKRRRRIRRRRARNQCVDCGYDLRATPTQCPECGRPVAKATPPRPRLPRVIAVAINLTIVLTTGLLFHRVTSVHLPRNYSWLAVGPLVYHEGDVAEAEKEVLELDKTPQWFSPVQRPATNVEKIVAQMRLFHSGLSISQIGQSSIKASNDPNIFDVESFPDSAYRPRDPQDIPLEQQGVTMSLSVSPDANPLMLHLMISLFSREHLLKREVEHRWTEVIPFLFAFEVDGKPVKLPPANGFGKEGGVHWWLDLVEQGDHRDWSLRLNDAGLRSLMPDAGPHTLSIIAAFSPRQYTADFGDDADILDKVFDDDFLFPETDPIFVRSNVARLRWTGSRWETAKNQ